MEYYKIFVNWSNLEFKHRKLDSLESDYYYSVIKEEGDIFNQQFIITNYIMKGLIKHYILNKKYDLSYIETSSDKLNSFLDYYCLQMENDRAYLALIIEEVFHSEEYLSIKHLEFKKHEEIINLSSNGIIKTNVGIDRGMLEKLKLSYLRE